MLLFWHIWNATKKCYRVSTILLVNTSHTWCIIVRSHPCHTHCQKKQSEEPHITYTSTKKLSDEPHIAYIAPTILPLSCPVTWSDVTYPCHTPPWKMLSDDPHIIAWEAHVLHHWHVWHVTRHTRTIPREHSSLIPHSTRNERGMSEEWDFSVTNETTKITLIAVEWVWNPHGIRGFRVDSARNRGVVVKSSSYQGASFPTCYEVFQWLSRCVHHLYSISLAFILENVSQLRHVHR